MLFVVTVGGGGVCVCLGEGGSLSREGHVFEPLAIGGRLFLSIVKACVQKVMWPIFFCCEF